MSNDEWGTPPALAHRFIIEFGITLDVCARETNRVCDAYFAPPGHVAIQRYPPLDYDGLSQDWSRNCCWMNPPYSNPHPWCVKAAVSALDGAVVVGLLPVDTSTKWYRRYVHGVAREVRWLPRIRFVGASGLYPKPSMLVIWDGDNGRNGTYHRCFDLTKAERGLL
jgi:phage N-6-adenine-methyltransferase